MPTGVNPAGDAGDTSPQFFVWGDVNGNIPPILLHTFGYSRPILVAPRSFSLKPISFGYKTPPIRFSQAGGESAHKARPPNLELALTPLTMPNAFSQIAIIYIASSYVTDSADTIRSPFCGYNMACVELRGDYLSCYLNNIRSVGL